MSTATALLEALHKQGIALVRGPKNSILVRPASKLTDDLRQQLKGLKEEIEALIPPLETISEHVPDHFQRPCVSPRLQMDTRCRAYPPDRLISAKSEDLQDMRREPHTCGDCDLAYAALCIQRNETERREKTARLLAKEKTNAKYRVPIDDDDSDTFQD